MIKSNRLVYVDLHMCLMVWTVYVLVVLFMSRIEDVALWDLKLVFIVLDLYFHFIVKYFVTWSYESSI